MTVLTVLTLVYWLLVLLVGPLPFVIKFFIYEFTT